MSQLPETVARTLREVNLNFDVNRPLGADSPYLVPLPRDPLRPLSFALERAALGPTTTLLNGHRGSGKSTQIRRLVSELRERQDFGLIPFYLDVQRLLDPRSLEYTDVLLAMASTLFETWRGQSGEDKTLGLGYAGSFEPGLVSAFERWSKKVVREVLDEEEAGAEARGEAKIPMLRALGFLKRSHKVATTIREEVEQDIDRLYDLINDAVLEIELATGKKVLIIVDGLDRTHLGKTVEVFEYYWDKLTQPQCSLLYVIDVSMPYHVGAVDMEHMVQRIENLQVTLPPWEDVERPLDRSDDGALHFLTQLVERRMERHLISDEALEEVARLSAGVVWYMVNIIQRAGNAARLRDAERIEVQDVEVVADHLSYQFLQQLNHREDFPEPQRVLELCDAIEADPRRVLPDPTLATLLHLLMVLEYPDSPRYFGVHPALLKVKDRLSQAER